MKEVTVSQMHLRDAGAICVANVQDGFDQYPYDVIKGDFVQFYSFLMAAYEWNGKENSYADFYYGNLKAEEQEKLLDGLGEESRILLTGREWNAGELYYRLDPELLGMLLETTYQELLFSTFYFTQFPCSVWGNYNGTFPVFYRDEFMKKLYRREILAQTGLEIES